MFSTVSKAVFSSPFLSITVLFFSDIMKLHEYGGWKEAIQVAYRKCYNLFHFLL